MKAANTFPIAVLLILQLGIVNITQSQNLSFYGMTNSGGTNNLGVIFKTDANGENQTVVYNFSGTDGSRPDNGKLCYNNGLIYGTTGRGGSNDMGVLFSYNPITEIYTKLHDFDGLNSGRNPYSNVIIASNGKLYGTTLYGGTNDFGTLFEYNIATNTLTKKLDFDGTNMGKNIYGNVIEATNGKLYGVTNRGGIYDWGVLYEYNYTTEMYSKLIDFDDTTIGRSPSILLEVENNILYGTANGGGANGGGTIFEYNISSDIITKKFDFEDSNSGSSPYLSLIKASNGKLYGFTKNGGANNYGVFYEYNILLESFNKILDFSSETGFSPTGNLLKASNGNLYGLTFYGGTNNDGTIFEYNISTNTFSKKLDFDSSNGSNPKGSLIEIEVSSLGNEEFTQSKVDVILWPNPVNDMIHVKSKEGIQFHVNIYNLLGQELQSNNKFQTNHQLNISYLCSGIYILKVTKKNGNTQTIKFKKS